MGDAGCGGKGRLGGLEPDDDITDVDVFAMPVRYRPIGSCDTMRCSNLVAGCVLVSYNVAHTPRVVP